MHEEGKLEEQRKGRSLTKDQTTQTQPMRHQRRDSSSHNRGPVDCDSWHQRRARSLTRRSDRLIQSKNRCRSNGRGVNQFRHSENWHFRNDRGQSSGKHNEQSSDYENWCRRRANNSSYESDPLVHFSNRLQCDGYKVNPIKRAPECDSCRCWNDPSQDGVKQTKHSDTEDWHKGTAHSSSPQSDRPVHNKSRCPSAGHGAHRVNQGSEWEDCGARNDRSQDGMKHIQRSSDVEKWRKRTTHESPCQSEQPVIDKDRLLITSKSKHASENWCAPNDRSRDGARNNECSSDVDHWPKMTACDSPRPSEQPIFREDGCHGNTLGSNKFQQASDCENWCSRNDRSRDEGSPGLENGYKTTAHTSSHGSEWPVGSASGPHGDGRGFNPFKQPSHCEICHSRNDCSQDCAKPSDCDNWRNRGAHSSYQPGVHFVVNKNRCPTNRYWMKPFKRATHARNWRSRNDRNKDGIKDSDHSYCKNLRQRNPHGTSRYAIWAIFNRKLSHKTHGNKAFAQLKSDCENWRSWNDRHRDHVDQCKQSPEDKNWRSMGDCARDQIERWDQSPDRDVSDQGEGDVQRVADRNKDRNETEVQNIHGSDTGRTVMLKALLASNYTKVTEVQVS